MSRPKGSLNKVTTQTKEHLLKLLSGESERVAKSLEILHTTDSKGYLDAIVKLYALVMPKPLPESEELNERPSEITFTVVKGES
ncbi:MAG: hypothetical protein ACI87M_000205 [Yoonia sp.]|jgi:hypothetical protein